MSASADQFVSALQLNVEQIDVQLLIGQIIQLLVNGIE